jgi:hypothetical protein
MYICSSDYTTATDQMQLYMQATQLLGNKPTFLTMGNHECTETTICTVGSSDGRFMAFMDALSGANISNQPYYSVDVTTNAGLARFVVVADNAWDSTQSSWLQSTLADADARAKYTFIMRHHPMDNVDLTAFQDIATMIRAHKYTILFTGHTHEYKLDLGNDPLGHTIVVGIGGAPFNGSGTYYGYGTVEQRVDDNLAVRIFDQATGNQTAAFTVSPQ